MRGGTEGQVGGRAANGTRRDDPMPVKQSACSCAAPGGHVLWQRLRRTKAAAQAQHQGCSPEPTPGGHLERALSLQRLGCRLQEAHQGALLRAGSGGRSQGELLQSSVARRAGRLLARRALMPGWRARVSRYGWHARAGCACGACVQPHLQRRQLAVFEHLSAAAGHAAQLAAAAWRRLEHVAAPQGGAADAAGLPSVPACTPGRLAASAPSLKHNAHGLSAAQQNAH